MVRAANCLNQDFQDFEDFFSLGVGSDGARSSKLFESGFSGFRGFLYVGRWFRWCAQKHKIKKKIPAFALRRCDNRIDEMRIKCIHFQYYPATFTNDVLPNPENPENPDSKPNITPPP